jgi:SAM-dependent methyltransferase
LLSPESTAPGSTESPLDSFPVAEEDRGIVAATAAARQRIAELAEVSRRSPLLDLATGPGAFVQGIAPMLSGSSLLVCTDIRALSLADSSRRLLPHLRCPTRFIVCDISAMPFRDGVFSVVTCFGGMGEIADMAMVLEECHRVLERGGVQVMAGDQFLDPSPSLRIADELGIGSVATADRLKASLERVGFNLTDYEVLYEGHDTDTLPDEDRCPLPARGDWFAYAVVAAAKSQKS